MSLVAGTRLGPYEIHSLIGAGGMGEVYRARDPRLGRDVAIKVLPESAGGPHLRRFEQEARAVAALSHPNVLAIFDVGIGDPPYLVSELLDGETLRARLVRGRLPLAAILDTARQFLSGLSAAHARGIIHRDLKPDNIFLTRDGVVKILDFGLAKSVAPAASTVSDVDVTSAPATIDGTILGTVGYMAPEQVRGAAIDHRCDIFAVGTVLYEMVTGDRAFRGDSPADTMSAILREQPRDVSMHSGVPPALGRIIQRCLEKSPDQRFQSAQDLRFALEGISQTDIAAPARPSSQDEGPASIAVLPFTDMSAQRDQAYFCEGMAEEIINALARVEGLRVAPRTSTFQARATTADLGQIADALGVRHLLEGSVRTAGQRLRVTAQVVDVNDRRAVWSDRFDGELADVFDIQETIAERIVTALKTRLVGATATAVESVRRQYTPKVEAYQAYLQGLHHRYTTYDLVESLRWFERATELDPLYADAHVGVAYVSAVLANFAFLSPTEARVKSRAAIAKAMEIDANLPVAHAALAWWTSLHEWNWARAEQMFQHALSLDASCLEAHAFYGLVCGALQREDEAVAHMSRLVQLDPLSPWTHGVSALAYHTIGRNDVALRESETALGLRADNMIGLWCKGMALRGLKRLPEAIATFEHAVEAMPAALYLLCELGCTCAQAGLKARAEAILRTLDERASTAYLAPFWRGTILFGLDRLDEAYAELERALHEGAPTLPFLGAGWWDQARGQARFADLARRIGLPPSVAQPRRA
jgi:serine/threonine-protein kinase